MYCSSDVSGHLLFHSCVSSVQQDDIDMMHDLTRINCRQHKVLGAMPKTVSYAIMQYQLWHTATRCICAVLFASQSEAS